jgi:hypothetical protein
LLITFGDVFLDFSDHLRDEFILTCFPWTIYEVYLPFGIAVFQCGIDFSVGFFVDGYARVKVVFDKENKASVSAVIAVDVMYAIAFEGLLDLVNGRALGLTGA